ncbi:MAG: DUF6056 family protein [Lachnospiraceae bacterium]|nr:DUF6056 family protein [Lachnospiraceae bacterium]
MSGNGMENGNVGKSRKWFLLTAICAFLSALVYEFLTPLLSDDLSYLPIVREAGSLPDIVGQEVLHYFNHGGRSVAHLIMRFFMYVFDADRTVFNVIAAAVFLLLTVLMYRLVLPGAEKEDTAPAVTSYLLIVLLVWLFAPSPGETMFWLTGACNYLFTTTLILFFFTLSRRFAGLSAKTPENKGDVARRAAVLFITGLLAGWCNENTSGGVVLFCLILLLMPRVPFLLTDEEAGNLRGQKSLLPIRLAALIGSLAGYIMQLVAPGNSSRVGAQVIEEHTGIMRYVARFLKIMSELETSFLPLLLAALFLFLLCCRQGRKWREPQIRNALLFFLLFLATGFCLILAPDPKTRVYFGPGIFLMISCAQLFRTVRWKGEVLSVVRDFAVCGLLLVFLFTYVREGANLARLYRETNARYDRIREAMTTQEPDADGDITVKLPELPAQFDSRYSIACRADISEDPWQFENLQVSQFFADNVFVRGYPFDEFMAENEQ